MDFCRVLLSFTTSLYRVQQIEATEFDHKAARSGRLLSVSSGQFARFRQRDINLRRSKSNLPMLFVRWRWRLVNSGRRLTTRRQLANLLLRANSHRNNTGEKRRRYREPQDGVLHTLGILKILSTTFISLHDSQQEKRKTYI